MEIGFAAKILGPDGKGLPAEDARKSQNSPNLGRSLELANVALDWLIACNIHFWRLPSAMAPYGTHPTWTQFHGQEKQYDRELAAFGERLRKADMRVTKHPGQYTVLGSPRTEVNDRSIADLALQSALLDRMGMGPEASVLVLHVGGRYDDPKAAVERFSKNVERLPESVRARLILENDDRLYEAAEVLPICEKLGLRMVFDLHHHRCHNPSGMTMEDAMTGALATWPAGTMPKLHLSSGREHAADRPHAWGIRDEDWEMCCRVLAGRDCDVMVEAKGKDHAVLALADRIRAGKLTRPDLLRHIPKWPTNVPRIAPPAGF